MSTFSERHYVTYYIPGEVQFGMKMPAYAMGIEITAFMNKHSIPAFIQPVVMQGYGLTLTWDWNTPIVESNPAQFIPYNPDERIKP